jgi:hypothetical protein
MRGQSPDRLIGKSGGLNIRRPKTGQGQSREQATKSAEQFAVS